MRAKHAAVVYHPVKTPLERIRRAAAEMEKRHGWDATRWYATGSDDAGRSAAEQAVSGGPAAVIVAGGDGTVRAVAEVAHERGIPVALVPLGTGNLLARNLGVPLNDLEACVAAAFSGAMLLIPAAVVDDGLLDVVMMRPKGRLGWAMIGTRLTVQGIARRSRLSRKMLRSAPALQALAYAQGKRFEAHFDSPHGIELDGDGFGSVVRVRISVRGAALQVRHPTPAG